MTKNIIRTIICIAIFILTVMITSTIQNEGKIDLTVEMQEATLPTVSILSEVGKINEMFGYTEEMNSEYLRDSITQIDTSRKIKINIDVKDAEIQGIFYEIRNLTGERLIEKNEITTYQEENGAIIQDVFIKDLIEPEQEYTFIISISLEDGRTANYYTRIIETDTYKMNEKVAFVKEFSDDTFDKEAALDLTKYLESNYLGDNSTFYKVNIHSSFYQITWGDLKVERISDKKIRILELQEETSSIEVSYTVKDTTESIPKYYFVTENYRLRYTTNRMYLLDFERTMEEGFDFNETSFINNKCLLGVASENLELTENATGEIVAFVNNNQLYSIMPEENKVSRVFGYYETVLDDTRSTNKNHEIKVLNCDEAGNIYFMVYGYHNRGVYEGKVGILIYYYNSNLNTIEEKIFISYKKSAELLIYEVDQLTYLSKSEALYLLMDHVLFSINVETGEKVEITDSLMEGSYTVSNSNETVAWLEGNSIYKSDTLTMINLNSKNSYKISANENTYIMPIGFMGEDLIYGEAYSKDIVVNSAGNTIFPMYRIYIKDATGNILKSYEEDNNYVVSCSIIENQINLERVVWDEENETYVETTKDQIVNNEIINEQENEVEVVITSTYEKQIQIVIYEPMDEEELLFLTPKEVLYEGTREIELNEEEITEERYYVYIQGKVNYISNIAGKAVDFAEANKGTVLNDYGEYIWYEGNRFVKNQIMAIKEKSITEDNSALSVCLDTMLEKEGIIRNSKEYIKAGQTVFEILESQLPTKQILDLTGCSLESTLYYVNQDIPVLVLLEGEEAVLVTGFNELQVVICNPSEGTLYKMGKKAASSWFEENGSIFVSYANRKN